MPEVLAFLWFFTLCHSVTSSSLSFIYLTPQCNLPFPLFYLCCCCMVVTCLVATWLRTINTNSKKKKKIVVLRCWSGGICGGSVGLFCWWQVGKFRSFCCLILMFLLFSHKYLKDVKVFVLTLLLGLSLYLCDLGDL